MARRMMARADRTWRGAHMARLRAAGLLLALGLALVACDAGGSSSSATATSTVPAGQATVTPTSASGTPASSPTTSPGSVAQSGSLDICHPATPTPVTASIPQEVPPYPNGRLLLAQANGSDAEFGYCATDSVSVVTAFYTQGLPGKGWKNIQTFSNLSTVNIIATRGANESLTITISPDTLQAGNTDLLIIVKGL
jgi:hypothetical protein